MSELLGGDAVDKLSELLVRQFGVSFGGDFLHYSKMDGDDEKIFLFSGSNQPDLRAEWIGLHLGTVIKGVFQPTIEGAQLLGPNASKGKVSVSKNDSRRIFRGEEVEVSDSDNQCVLVESGGVFICAGSIESGRISGFIPASRKILN